MRHAKFLGHRPLGRVGIDADDLVGANHACALDDVEADPAKAEHGDICPRPHFRGVDDGADTGRHAAADVTNLSKGASSRTFASAISGSTEKFAKVEHPM